MRLLITTQVMDKDHPVMGFFHRWVEAFATRFDEVHVICLQQGRCELPAHVHVHSLGKEGGESRLKYVWRFFQYVHRLRGRYDSVYVHMNPHYAVLAGWYWRLRGIPVLFWRNHAKMNLLTQIAARFATRVLYTSPAACTRRFKHSVQMPVGIDTSFFESRAGVERQPRSTLFLGRLAPVKRPELLLAAAKLRPSYQFHVYGNAAADKRAYEEALVQTASQNVQFHGPVANDATPPIYSAHEVYVNLTPDGSMDKTMLEAAACGALILVSNSGLKDVIPTECFLADESPEGIAAQLDRLFALPADTKERYTADLIAYVQQHHSLESLVTKYISLL